MRSLLFGEHVELWTVIGKLHVKVYFSGVRSPTEESGKSGSSSRVSSKRGGLAVTMGWGGVSCQQQQKQYCFFWKRGCVGWCGICARPGDPLSERRVPTVRAHQPHLPPRLWQWLQSGGMFCVWLWQEWVRSVSDNPPNSPGRKLPPKSKTADQRTARSPSWTPGIVSVNWRKPQQGQVQRSASASKSLQSVQLEVKEEAVRAMTVELLSVQVLIIPEHFIRQHNAMKI